MRIECQHRSAACERGHHASHGSSAQSYNIYRDVLAFEKLLPQVLEHMSHFTENFSSSERGVILKNRLRRWLQ